MLLALRLYTNRFVHSFAFRVVYSNDGHVTRDKPQIAISGRNNRLCACRQVFDCFRLFSIYGTSASRRRPPRPRLGTVFSSSADDDSRFNRQSSCAEETGGPWMMKGPCRVGHSKGACDDGHHRVRMAQPKRAAVNRRILCRNARERGAVYGAVGLGKGRVRTRTRGVRARSWS